MTIIRSLYRGGKNFVFNICVAEEGEPSKVLSASATGDKVFDYYKRGEDYYHLHLLEESDIDLTDIECDGQIELI